MTFDSQPETQFTSHSDTQSDSPFDYQKHIDSETWSFIHRTTAAFPENAASLSIAEQRVLYNAMCESFHAGRAPSVITRDDIVGHVPIRTYLPEQAKQTIQLVYVHGGGFVVGGLESHDDVCAEISDRSQCQLTSVDYRLSPEAKHPAALDDTLVVIDHLWQQHGQAIVLCGDSAGATLCAAAAHAYRNLAKQNHKPLPRIRGQVLIYPSLGGDMSKGSYKTHARAPMLTTEEMSFYSDARCAPDTQRQDPLFAPLQDHDFSGLPATRVFSAECDPLSDDGMHYCQRLNEAGGDAQWVNEYGLVHGYLRARHTVKRAEASFERIVQAVNLLLV